MEVIFACVEGFPVDKRGPEVVVVLVAVFVGGKGGCDAVIGEVEEIRVVHDEHVHHEKEKKCSTTDTDLAVSYNSLVGDL